MAGGLSVCACKCGWVLILGLLGEIIALAVCETRWAVYYTHICLVYIVTPQSQYNMRFCLGHKKLQHNALSLKRKNMSF